MQKEFKQIKNMNQVKSVILNLHKRGMLCLPHSCFLQGDMYKVAVTAKRGGKFIITVVPVGYGLDQYVYHSRNVARQDVMGVVMRYHPIKFYIY